MIYFTSDTHFGHSKLVELRGFGSVAEMDEALIDTWNSQITNKDQVYFLGDFCLSNSSGPNPQKYLDVLKGQKFLIAGNHDDRRVRRARGWSDVRDYMEFKFDHNAGRQVIVLSHYPMISWNRKQYGSWMLHGHCHGTLPDYGMAMMDVGVDACGLRPVSLQDVIARIG